MEEDNKEEHESEETKNYISGGIACIVIGLGLACYFIGIPIYKAKNNTTSEITLYEKAIGLAILLPMLGTGMILFKEKLFEWVPTEKNQKITLKHIIYLVITVSIFLFIYSQITSYLESLGFKENVSY